MARRLSVAFLAVLIVSLAAHAFASEVLDAERRGGIIRRTSSGQMSGGNGDDSQSKKGGGARQKVLGLTEKMCKPCPNGGPQEFCDGVKDECAQLFCDPMCVSLLWEVEAKATGAGPVDGFQDEMNSPKVQKALTGQMIAHGCENKLEACKKGSLFDFVENRVFQDQYPHPAVPIKACEFDVLDKPLAKKMCSGCKSAVSVEAKMKPEGCAPLAEKSSPSATFVELLEGTSLGRYASLLSEDERAELGLGSESDLALLRARRRGGRRRGRGRGRRRGGRRDGGGGDKSFDVGEPAHKNLMERCEEFEKKVKSKLSSMKSEFKKKLCGCLGCCPDVECFYPVTINSEKDVELSEL